MQGCTDLGRQVAMATKCCTGMPNIFEYSLWNLRLVTLLARRIMVWFQYFLEICVALKVTPEGVSRSSDWLVAGRLSVSLHSSLKLDQTQNQPSSLLCYMKWRKRASRAFGTWFLARGNSARDVGRAVHLLPC
jgi:hypothetical protein